jgi:hypothetical protein
MITGNGAQMGLGDVGVVSNNYYSETAFTSNAALLANGHRYAEARLGYSPWLRALVPDIDMVTHSFSGTINEHHALGLYVKTFSLGNIQFTDQNGNFIRDFNPNEFLIQLNYATWFKNGLSAGIGLKYIYSNLTGGISVGGAETRPGQAIAADLGINWRKHYELNESTKMGFSLGAGFNNIGSKMSYTNTNQKDFLPMNMQLGAMFSPGFKWGKFRLEFDLAYQVTKLLVPTPPEYALDANGNLVLDANNNRVISAGMDPNVSVPVAFFQSFADAPGGSAEEFREVNHQFSVERRLVINDIVSIHLREGFFYEPASKGDRQFVTLGAGVGFYGFRFDFSYWIPLRQQHPLANTIGIGLGYRLMLGKVKKRYAASPWNPMEEKLEAIEIMLEE